VAAHRGMGSANERQAAEWLAAKLRDLGYEVAAQPFRTTRDNLYLLPAQVFLGAVAACVVALVTPFAWIGLVLLAYGMAVLLAETSGFAVDLTPMPRFTSQNVFTGPTRRVERTIFVTAHYDTQRGSFLFHPRFVDRLPLFFNVCYSGLALALLGVLMKVAGLAASIYLLWTALVLCACACAVYLAAELGGRYTPGANDNGTGVALALWLAAEYALHSETFPPECDLRFLFTGSEEAGCRGMKAFLKSHEGLDPRRVRFVNLDNLGTGMVTFLSGEGMLIYRRAGTSLLAVARALMQELNAGDSGRKVQEHPNLLLPTDALPPSARGFEAISFLGKDAAGRMGNYHWHTDTFANVDGDFLRSQQEFFREFLRRAMAAQPVS
jgi:Peptidase family M28